MTKEAGSTHIKINSSWPVGFYSIVTNHVLDDILDLRHINGQMWEESNWPAFPFMYYQRQLVKI